MRAFGLNPSIIRFGPKNSLFLYLSFSNLSNRHLLTSLQENKALVIGLEIQVRARASVLFEGLSSAPCCSGLFPLAPVFLLPCGPHISHWHKKHLSLWWSSRGELCGTSNLVNQATGKNEGRFCESFVLCFLHYEKAEFSPRTERWGMRLEWPVRRFTNRGSREAWAFTLLRVFKTDRQIKQSKTVAPKKRLEDWFCHFFRGPLNLQHAGTRY